MANIPPDVFNKTAQTYNRARRQLIPCFADFYGTALNLIPFKKEDPFQVLDLGAGTGLLSQFVADSFPQASLTLIDRSEKMLEKARERLSNQSARTRFINADYSDGVLPGEFDLVVSALSIHHLPDNSKQGLFTKIYEALGDSSIFINADQVLGSSPAIEASYREHWLQEVRRLGVSDTDLAAAFDRMQEDKMATLEDQLAWLADAGFQNVNCWYKNYNFVVYSGSKSH